MNARPPLQGSIWALPRAAALRRSRVRRVGAGAGRVPQTRIFCGLSKRGTMVSWHVRVAERNATQRGLGSAPRPRSLPPFARGERLHADERAVYGNGEERLEMLGRHRPREEEALALVAAQVLQLETLLVGLDAFRRHVHVEALGHGDHRAHDGAVAALVAEPLHEGAVDLERVHREALEIAERRVPGAEVVDGEPHAQVLELAELGESGGRVLHHHALRDLELEAAGVEN